MMNKILPAGAVVLLFFLAHLASAQTAGSSILATIESKANQIEQNDSRFAELNRTHLGTYSLESEKLAKLRQELHDLEVEKELVLEDYRAGYFCSGCGKSRTEFAPGEVFPHQGQKIVPATREQIAAKEKEYDTKISAKAKQLKEFEFSENEFTRKRDDLTKQMNAISLASDNLREEIVELSKRYNDAVVREAKSIVLTHITPLMKITADKHFIEDRLSIIAVKLEDLTKEENEAIQNAREKARQDIEEKKANLQAKINSNNTLITQLYQGNLTRVAPYKTKLSDLNRQLDEVKKQLTTTSGKTAEDIEELNQQQLQLEGLIADSRTTITDFEKDYTTRKTKIEIENKELADKIWLEYTVNASKIIDDAEETVQKAYALRRKILTDAKAARTVSLQQTGQLLIDQTAARRKLFMEYATIVDKERIRLMRACSKAGCSCYGTDVHGTVVSLWQTAEGCIGQMENRHSGGAYYSCEEEAAIYQSYYTANVNGLSDSDLEAYQRKNGKLRFDMITRKISD